MIYPKTLKNKKYPEFIRNNSTIKKYSSPEKNFERIGLSDFSKPYIHKCDVSLTSFVASLKDLLQKVSNIYKNKIHYDYCYYSAHDGEAYLLNKQSASVKIDELIKKITIFSIRKKDGSKLFMPASITILNSYRAKKITYKKGSPLSSLLVDLYDDITDMYSPSLSRDFETAIKNILDLELSLIKTLKIVFSTHHWDIATMSMRGIKSCQAWGKAQSPCLIGSIVDPNAAVIYLTDGKPYKKYGKRMLARSVVRLVVPAWTIRPNDSWATASAEEQRERYLYIEGSYTNFGQGVSEAKTITDLFYAALTAEAKKSACFKRIDKNKDRYSYQIPLSSAVRRLREGNRSYRDGGLSYTNKII